MKKIGYHLYNITFWISRFVTMFVFGICLSMVLHAKYALIEKTAQLFIFFSKISDTKDSILHFFILTIFCKNAQGIDLLLITLAIILILSIIIIKFVNKEYRYLLTVGIISSTIYLVTYSIFKLPVMLALTISTPIILTIIYFLNRICPIQKVIMLVPIIGEIFCIKSIIKYISNKTSDKILNIFLLITALILSNIICFLFPYKTNKDFENLIMTNWTYSIRPYQDKLIISGDNELIIIDNDNRQTYVKNNQFGDEIQDFIIDKNKIYIYNYSFPNSHLPHTLLILDVKTLNIINKINMEGENASRFCCNYDCSKLLVIFEYNTMGYLINLNTYKIKYFKGIEKARDGLIYNKYRNCFLVSFHDENSFLQEIHKEKSFLQEIDIENKKMRKIKADKYQGYLAISERNKEIYVAFHQQGRIGVYDAETMKLKRKIKSNYTVKDITYDEELNILIAPSYFTGYVDIFLMDGSDKLLTREFVGYELREGCFDPKKENLYVCSVNGLYKKKVDIRKLIEENIK